MSASREWRPGGAPTSDSLLICEVDLTLCCIELSTKCRIFFETAAPIPVQRTDFSILLILHKCQRNAIYDKEITSGLYFSDFRLIVLLLEIVKRGRIVQTELAIASRQVTICRTINLKMNSMNSVEGQASLSDERYLF